MILFRWQGTAANFGDELNTVLWPRLLPGFFDNDPDTLFLGIGSVLDGRHPAHRRKLVAGSGYGGYESRPRLDRNWVIHWVRGPRTARTLGLPESLALGDPAALLPLALDAPAGHAPPPGMPAGEASDIGFMPHFESAQRGAWQQAASQAGLRLIDPRDPPLTILHAMARCKLVLSEALHGVIVADALRIPWVAIRPLGPVHRAKWWDWSATVGLSPRFSVLPASTLTEWARASRLRSWHTTRTWLRHFEPRLDAVASPRMVARAGRALEKAARADPQLSSDAALDRCRSRMLDAVSAMRAHPFRPATAVLSAQARTCLRKCDDFAYEVPVIG